MMAKAKRNISNKRPMTASLPQKKDNSKLVFLGAVTIVFVLLIALFLMSGNDVPETQTQTTQTGSTETIELSDAGEQEQDLLGMAFGNINDPNDPDDFVSYAPPKGEAGIHPLKFTAVLDAMAPNTGKSFGVDVKTNGVYDGHSSIDCNNQGNTALCSEYSTIKYEIHLFYDPAHLSLDSISSNFPGWVFAPNYDDGNGNVHIIAESGPNYAICFLSNEVKTKGLVELTFTPLIDGYNAEFTDIELINVVFANSLGPNGAPVSVFTVPFSDATVFPKMIYYQDLDDDTFGNAGEIAYYGKTDTVPADYVKIDGDCDDNPFDDPANCVNGQLDCTNAFDNTYCAYCIKPGADEVCDGVDNNCDDLADLKEFGGDLFPVTETCADVAKECGMHWVCHGTKLVDCNNQWFIPNDPNTWGSQLLLSDKENCVDILTNIDPANPPDDAYCEDGSCMEGSLQSDCNDLENEIGGCIVHLSDIIPVAPDTSEDVIVLSTPACGEDGDLDLELCDYFENYMSCPPDCDPCHNIDECDSCLTLGYTDAQCMIDTDMDGLPDAYEVDLEAAIPANVKVTFNSQYPDEAGMLWFNPNKADSDGDMISDSADFCPRTPYGSEFNLKKGKVKLNGCPLGDAGGEKSDMIRPDGCYSSKDTTFSIAFYTSSVNPNHNCVNIFGSAIK
jgi:hypothetical protein